MLNKKGTVLVVAIVAMVIMMIIGAICLQIFTNQSLLDSYDQIKMRTFYSAEGAVELMRAYIEKEVQNNLVNSGSNRGDSMNSCRGFLSYVTRYDASASNKFKEWKPFIDAAGATKLLKGPFDGTMHPAITAEVTLKRLRTKPSGLVFRDSGVNIEGDIFAAISGDGSDNRQYRGYEIVATAYTTHKTTMGTNQIKTTLRYYFYTKREKTTVGSGSTAYDNYTNKIKWVAWRRD